ncbi:hypothetical protein IW261DRAFT_1439639 [Armillaria novae-zelandiae]|uniref:BZIP domain-containing protein n=1 Tax=Armillaria novae-zelandiae TaxID=153914 RepID=A0AA39PSL9_9AGAR|nr:hypothetical protein IW261DRAFT_1439639 [Armillaria novae-zelandiae]
MTRGRKKDPTIPITRSLAQQRDYRARRAQYIADLEKKCHLLEMENYDLRQELRYLNAPSPYVNPASGHDLSHLTDMERFEKAATLSDAAPRPRLRFPPSLPSSSTPSLAPSSPANSHTTAEAEESDVPQKSKVCRRVPRFPRDILRDEDESEGRV